MKQERGFSLVEVMVVTGILGVVGLAATQLFSNLNKGQGMVSSLSNFESLKSSVRLVIQNTKLCNGAFLNSSGQMQVYNPTSQNFEQSFYKIKTGPSQVAEVGTTVHGLKITNLFLKPFGHLPSTPYKESGLEMGVLKEYYKYYVTLQLAAQDTVTKKVRSANFDMVLLTDQATHAIEKCYVQMNDKLKPNIVFEMGVKSDGNTSNWYCHPAQDLKAYCGDENGCRVNVRMIHKANFDQTLSASSVIYMEQESLSNNTFPGRYGGTMQGFSYTNEEWHSGNPTNPYYNVMAPWKIFYMMTYTHEYCGTRAGLPEYHFSFISHPLFTTSVEIQDNPFP